eukprot:TRINITY_DN600_c0_g1_i1.p1 TRINITY_DN600_c0_g1~~TRINITY_DN600_c0_g1_i1.p1  ORF type:complete len:445 (-),score=67.08 TRINITY_DN600_c0_g1_i1:850-2184(-)
MNIGDRPSSCDSFSQTYQKNCELVSVAPNQTLLFEIENIYGPTGNQDLDLSEIFEEIGSKDVKPIFLSLEKNIHFKSITIKNMKTSDESLEHLFNLFRRNRLISGLSLTGVELNEQCLEEFSVMSCHPHNLQHLDFSFSHIDASGWPNFCDGLRALSPKLRSLNISHCSFSSTQMAQLFLCIKKKSNFFCQLKVLDISFNQLGKEGSETLCSILPQLRYIERLNVSSTNVSLSQLFGGLAIDQISSFSRIPLLETEQKIGPMVLDISGNNVVEEKDLTLFSNWLGRVGDLKLLNCCGILSHWKRPPSQLRTIFQSLFHDKQIEGLHLDFSENRLGTEGAKVISQIFDGLANPSFGSVSPIRQLGSSKTLRSLDLSGNSIGDDGFQLLCNALEFCPTIEELGLGRNLPCLGRSVSSYCQTLRRASMEALVYLLNQSNCSVSTFEI